MRFSILAKEGELCYYLSEVIKMKQSHSRTISLIGEEAHARLSRSRVLIFGIGGVGGHLTEALARAGVGHLTLVDSDVVCESNINRQAVALHSTVGRDKVEVMMERIIDINPSAEVFCKISSPLADCV